MSNRATQISLALLAAAIVAPPTFAQRMDKMWGDRDVQAGVESSERAALFRDGNYGMFIHWGLYSHLGGKWKGETFYGIGEWIKRQMKIPQDEYMALAKEAYESVAARRSTLEGFAAAAGTATRNVPAAAPPVSRPAIADA